MRLMPMLLALVLPGAAAAQGEWESFDAEGWTGARVCPFGEIREGGYFCLELACPEGGPVGFRVRLTEAEVQPVVEGMWTVNRRAAGEILMAPLEGAPGQYFAPYDAIRDTRLIARMLDGSEGSFTIVNRPIRAVRPFTLEGAFEPMTEALESCALETAPEEVAQTPAPGPVIEVVPPEPEEFLLVVPADPIETAPAAPADALEVMPEAGREAAPEVPSEPSPEVGPVILRDGEPEAVPEVEAEAQPEPEVAAEAEPGPAVEADPDAGPEAAEAAPADQTGPEPPATAPSDPGPLVAEDGSVSDPAALVLQEIETACVERGGAFVEVQQDFVRRADFDGDGTLDMEVSYSGAVCDAAAGLYCDTESCLTRLYLGREDGRFLPAFEDVYMSARVAPAFVVTYDAGSAACPEAETPCERTFIWQDGALVPVEAPQP